MMRGIFIARRRRNRLHSGACRL